MENKFITALLGQMNLEEQINLKSEIDKFNDIATPKSQNEKE